MARTLAYRAFFVVGALLVSTSSAATDESVRGVVVDGSGATLPGSTITLTASGQKALQRTTGADGSFEFHDLTPGSWNLVVSLEKFEPANREVTVPTSPSETIRIVLQPAKLSESVVVTDRLNEYADPTENTATRLGLSFLDLPQSVSAIPEAVIRDQGAVQLSEVLRNAAGVTLTGTYFGTYERFTLRGFSQSQVSTFFRNGARFVMLSSPTPASVEQVEVLKGPASIMYGNVTPGGVINLVTKRPREDHAREITVRRSSFNNTEAIVDLTGPLTRQKTLLYRLNFYGRRADSFRDVVNQDFLLANPVLTWRVRPGTTVTVEGEYERMFSLTDLGLVAPVAGNFSSVAMLPRSRFLGDPAGEFRGRKSFYSADVDHELGRGWRARGSWNLHYFHRDVKQVAAVSLAADGQTLNRRTNAFLQHYYNYFAQADVIGSFRTGPLTHTVVLGADSLLGRWNGSRNSLSTAAPIDIFNPVYGLPMNFAYSQNFPSKNKQIGYTVQDNITLPYGFQALLGARYTTVEDFEVRTRDRNVSPRAGLLYRPVNWLSLYGSYSQSFEPNSGFDFKNARFAPSLGRQVEAGTKQMLFGGRLQTSLALFRLRRTNVLTADPFNIGFSLQSGLQESQGVEFEAQGEINRHWQIISSYTHTDTAILRDNTFSIGNQLGAVPRHAASIWSNHRFAGRLRNANAGFGIFYVGSLYDSNLNRFKVPAYTTTDISVGYRLGEFTRVQFNVKNLLDKTYYTAGGNLLSIYPGQPRTYQGGVTLSF
jgi:iron complex outermembrane receptor protein